MRGNVTGTSPGDSVEVWFEGGGETSESFTYQAVSETGRRVLVVAAEDYSGASPVQAAGPHYVQYYLDALAANGVAADVYDVDARGRIAPDHIGVLSHYDAVIWYTGNDVVTRRAGWGPGNADRLALDEMLEFRAYMNEGGRVAYTGKRAGQQFSEAVGVGRQFYDPKGSGPCSSPPDPPWDERRCLPLGGSLFGGDLVNDTLQYWFGGFVQVANDGSDPGGGLFDINGIADPFARHELGIQRRRRREEPGLELVVRHDQRHPAAGRLPAVRELAVIALGQAGRAVRPAYGSAVRLLANRRRVV